MISEGLTHVDLVVVVVVDSQQSLRLRVQGGAVRVL